MSDPVARHLSTARRYEAEADAARAQGDHQAAALASYLAGVARFAAANLEQRPTLTLLDGGRS